MARDSGQAEAMYDDFCKRFRLMGMSNESAERFAAAGVRVWSMRLGGTTSYVPQIKTVNRQLRIRKIFSGRTR